MKEHRANQLPDDAPDPDATYPQAILCDNCHQRVARLAEAASNGWSVYGFHGHCPDCPPLCHRCGNDVTDPVGETLTPATCDTCRGEG